MADSNSDFSSYDEVPEFSLPAHTNDQEPRDPSTDEVTCPLSPPYPRSTSPSTEAEDILGSNQQHDSNNDHINSSGVGEELSASTSTIQPSLQNSVTASTKNILHKAQHIVAHPVSTTRKIRSQHYASHHERKGKRKPMRICKELDKLESPPGSNTTMPSNTNKSSSSHNPIKMVKSLSKSHPKRLSKQLASSTLSNHVLGLDLDPFRLTKSDIDFINLVSKRRFETDGALISEHNQKLQELKIARRKMLVNWVSDRHIRSASVVRGKAISYPNLEQIIGDPKVGWEGYLKYFGDLALFYSQRFIPVYTSPWTEVPKYERLRTLSHVERIAIGIAPFQEWAMLVRRVYRWEDPVKTARWLGVYCVLWWYGYLVSFGYAYLIARVLRNRQDWNEVERVKAAICRARDQQQNVHRITELIERHGSDGWVEALPDSIGSWSQLKLGDLADLLEVIRNFYEWRSPAQTTYTLIFFSACLALSVFTSFAYCWRIITFVFGIWFFISSPIASWNPRYRIVVSPLKWVFWGIPTHADIAYSEFRTDAINAVNDPDMKKKAAKRRRKKRREMGEIGPVMVIDDDRDGDEEGFVTDTPEIDEDEEYDPEALISPHDMEHDPESLKAKYYIGAIYCGFKCLYRGHPGKLYVSDWGLVFETEIKKKVILEVKWRDIMRIQKDETLSVGKIGKVHALIVGVICGEDVRFEAVARRDKAFNRIIGFSGLQWQSSV